MPAAAPRMWAAPQPPRLLLPLSGSSPWTQSSPFAPTPLESDAMAPQDSSDGLLQVRNLTISFGTRVIQRELSFSVRQGSIFAVMGGSGCGKSTLLRAMVGLLRPATGTVVVHGEDYWAADKARRAEIARRFGVSFQSGALWSSMT